jgi:lipoprotein-anchoring transpeptidase ErfK/SrfK
VPAYPSNSRERGKRIVYDKALMTIWLIDGREQVVARFPVVGRPDRPAVGVYRVYSKSEQSANPIQKLTFKNMVRFARGQNTGAPIGFHDIPRTYDGRPIHGEDWLGLPLGSGGCVRMSTDASEQVYSFAGIGTTVEVT